MMSEEMRDTPEAKAEHTEPRGPAGGNEGELGKTSTGLDPKLAAFLAYLLSIFLSFLSGLLFYLTERDNKFVRFHSLQSVFFNLAVIAVSIVLTIITAIIAFVPVVGIVSGAVLWLVFVIGALVIWVVLMVKSLQGEYYKLPYIGDLADRNA